MKKLLFFLFLLFIGVGIFVWLIEMVGGAEIKLALLTFSGWQGIIILGLTCLMALSAIWRWREILKGQGYDLSIISLTRPHLAGFSIMYLAPMIMFGGEILKSYLLKEKFSIPWAKALASVILDRILDWTIYLIIIFIGLFFFFFKIGLPPKNLVIIFGSVLAFFVFVLATFYFKGFRKESIAKFFAKFINYKSSNEEPMQIEKEIFQLLNPKSIFFWKAIGLTLLRNIFALVRVWFLVLFLSKSIGIWPVLSISGFAYLASLIPIPAALGSHEAIQTFAFSSLNFGGAGTGAAFTMIIRGAELVIALVGLFFLFRQGMNLLKMSLLKKLEGIQINGGNSG